MRLGGENRIDEFRRIAEALASRIAALEGVTGIVFIGGLVRGFADKFSDVDVIVFLDKKDNQLRKRIRKMSVEEQRRTGVDVDLEVHFLEDFETRKWDEVTRWEFSRARNVYDPQGKVRRVWRQKLKISKDFWVKRIVVCSEYLKWYCCPFRRGEGTMAEAWVERGDLVSAHYCLNYSADLLFRLVFALNKEFLPAPKWRVFYAHGLKWLPKGFDVLVKEAMLTRDFSAEDFDRRLRAIRSIWKSILPKIKEETGLTPHRMSQYYVERMLLQSTATHSRN
jgi:predicted nucleotidyltransferase